MPFRSALELTLKKEVVAKISLPRKRKRIFGHREVWQDIDSKLVRVSLDQKASLTPTVTVWVMNHVAMTVRTPLILLYAIFLYLKLVPSNFGPA